MEYLMDHLANQLGMDPLELRLKNLLKSGDPLVNGKTFIGDNPIVMMLQKLKKSSNFEERQRAVDEFNKVYLNTFSR